MQGKSVRIILALLILLGAVTVATGAPQEQVAITNNKPNMVFILTDDMRKDDLKYMPNTKKLIKSQGTTFKNAFVTYSLCCPARATFLRGQYTHNHRVLTNAPSTHGSEIWFRKMGRDNSTVATWLDDAGYRTGHVGKYMNAYKDSYVPPGWDEWHTLSGPFHKDLKMNDNGTIRRYADKTIDNLVASKSLRFLRASGNKPFYLQVDTHAPHGPHDYPAKYENKFRDVKAPRPPSYNERDVSDKPDYIKESAGDITERCGSRFQRTRGVPSQEGNQKSRRWRVGEKETPLCKDYTRTMQTTNSTSSVSTRSPVREQGRCSLRLWRLRSKPTSRRPRAHATIMDTHW